MLQAIVSHLSAFLYFPLWVLGVGCLGLAVVVWMVWVTDRVVALTTEAEPTRIWKGRQPVPRISRPTLIPRLDIHDWSSLEPTIPLRHTRRSQTREAFRQ